ncbi:hypothetical protein JL475_28220 [Streptomyces sp. M2CJ-2]|uniref:hypothetical protein n=1 Tax=Streptomyces sp. M2CJ-2 TaxID=2803948 RepID=UPI0019284200|nr:hypothetical protein [Streptomyces sp. M2CJ-2]MBL3669800.1 hypothetical protein [Streptomyces sp. M2CJ-2]
MELYIAIPSVLVALLFTASGVAAVTRGWVLPMTRRRVRRVRLHGWGQLVVAFALCWQVVFGLVISNPGIRSLGTLFGGGLLLTGIIVMMVSNQAGGTRQGSGTP